MSDREVSIFAID